MERSHTSERPSARTAYQAREAPHDTDLADEMTFEARLRLLARAGAILDAERDPRRTFVTLARIAVPELADWCSVDVLTDRGRIERAATLHADREHVAWARREFTGEFVPTMQDEWGIGAVIRTGEAEFAPELTDEMLSRIAPSGRVLRVWRELGARSVMIVPLQCRGRILGAMTLALAESGRVFAGADFELALELGRRAAIAAENARLAREAAIALGEAERASEAKSQFLAVMSHELRTPLTGIIGYADLLTGGVAGETTDMQHRYIERIRTGAWHLVSLIEAILSFARSERDEPCHRDRLDVVRLARDAMDLVSTQAEEKGLWLRPPAACEPILADTDAGKFRQILLNLLGNAVKFTQDGGVSVDVATEDGSAIVRVSDTGPGIDPADLKRIFEPFTQADSSNTRSSNGAGLGLAVSRRLADMLGAEVYVESSSPAGSTFALKLPLPLPE